MRLGDARAPASGGTPRARYRRRRLGAAVWAIAILMGAELDAELRIGRFVYRAPYGVTVHDARLLARAGDRGSPSACSRVTAGGQSGDENSQGSYESNPDQDVMNCRRQLVGKQHHASAGQNKKDD